MKSNTKKPAKKTPASAAPSRARTPAKAPAKAAPAPPPPRPVPPLLKAVCRALDEKKAVEARVLNVGEHSSITDYLVVATGTSEPHLRALRVAIEKAIDASGARIIGMDTGSPGSGWLVIDAFDVMVHVLTQENRDRYTLEKLWKDAIEIPFDEVFAKAPRAPAKKRPAKKAG